MQRDVFLKLLQAKIAQITFSGHRVNDQYTLNKRAQIFNAVVVFAFDDAAQLNMEPISSEIGGAKPDVVIFDDIHGGGGRVKREARSEWDEISPSP